MKLATKLTFLFLLLSLLPLALVGYLAYESSRRAIEQNTQSRLIDNSIIKRDEFNRWLDNSGIRLRQFARRPSIQGFAHMLTNPNATETERQTARVTLRQQQFVPVVTEEAGFLELFLLDSRSGQILVSTEAGQEGEFREDEAYFIEGQGGTYVDNVRYSLSHDQAVLYIGTPVNNEAGTVAAILAGRLDLSIMNEIMRQESGLHPSQETFLVNRFNQFVTNPKSGDDLALQEAVYTVGVQACLAGDSGVGLYDNYRGRPVLGAYRWLPEHDLCLLTEIDQAEALAPVQQLGNVMFGIGGLIAGAVALLAVIFARTITNPVQALVKGAEAIGRGNLTIRLPETSRDELGSLAYEFNAMTAALAEKESQLQRYTEELEERVEERTASLRQSEARFRHLFANHPHPMWVYDRETLAFLEVNAAAVDRYGYTRDEFRQMRLSDIRRPEDIPLLLENLGQERPALEVSGPWRHKLKDGQLIDVEISSHTLDFAGQPAALVMAQDITKRKQAEQALVASEKQLQIRARQQAAVAQVGQFALGEPGLQSLFDEVAAVVAETLQIPFCQVLELLPSAEALRLRAGVGWQKGLVGTTTVGAGLHSQAGYTLQSERPVIVSDLRTETRFKGSPLLLDHGIVSSLSCIIPGGNGPFGVLGAYTNEHSLFTQDDVNFLTSMANVLAAAIERQRYQEEAHYLATIVESTDDAIIGKSLDGTIKSWNAGAERMYGYKAAEAIGQHISFIAPAGRQSEVSNFWQQLADGGRIEHFETKRIRKDGSVIDVSLSVSPINAPDGSLTGAAAIGRNITVLKKVQREREELLDRERTARQQAERATEQISFLAKAGAILGSSLDYEETLTAVTRLATPHIADWCTVSLLNDDGLLEQVAVAHIDPEKVQLAKRLAEQYPSRPDNNRGNYRVLASGVSELYAEITDNMLQMGAADETQLEILRGLEMRSAIVVPMIARGQQLGVLSFVSTKEGVQYDEEDLRMAEELGVRVATAVDNARLYRETKQLAVELEARVRQRTAQLESANKELEAFTYSVSHDLRAPLRAMNGFARILVGQFAAELPPQAQHYLQRVSHNAEQMGRLVDDLLAFSRLGRTPLKKQRVALDTLVRQVLADLEHERGERHIEISLGEMPACQADPALLKQLYANLLENALKYTRQREVARIEVGSFPEAAEVVYFVRDNGIGFDMQYVDKLFGVFQRLHRADEYEGTGVGLATVQRIVRRHGGRVWAQAEVNNGAAFYFTLGGNDE